MQKYILFGAGKYVYDYIHVIQFLGGNVEFIVDNNNVKQGETIEGIEIVSPKKLFSNDYPILISSVHQNEIEKQLAEMLIQCREISLYDCLSTLLIETGNRFSWEQSNNNAQGLFFDLFSGAKWGGAENWNIRVAEEVNQRTNLYNVSLIADDCIEVKEKVNVDINYISRENLYQIIFDLVRKQSKVVFVNSFFGELFFAMIAIKLMYPENVKIVTVVHNDYEDLYTLCDMFKEFVDKYICVSSKILATLYTDYEVAEEKATFLYQPITFDRVYEKKYEIDNPIKIGFASRLVIPQKRCDLIPDLISELEKTGVEYVLHIAGDGDMYHELAEYIESMGFIKKVILYGHLDSKQMIEFWKNSDIYVNISEFEGTSLSMLEAMGFCCVPVVTDVSGVNDYIEDGVNGYIHQIGDLEGIASSIAKLAKDRKMLEKLGQRSHKQIVKKCNIADYSEKLIREIERE